MAVKSGDELGLAVAKAMHAKETTARAWELEFLGAGEGWARCAMCVSEDMLNGHGTAHGGVIFSIADTAFAWACNSRNVVTFAQSATISFLATAKPGERLIAEAREESASGRTGVYTVRVTGEDDRIIAVFQGLSRTAGGDVVSDEELSNG